MEYFEVCKNITSFLLHVLMVLLNKITSYDKSLINNKLPNKIHVQQSNHFNYKHVYIV